MENIIIPGDMDITLDMLKDLCRQIEMDDKKSILRIAICSKHFNQLGIREKRIEYQTDMIVKIVANLGKNTIIIVDPESYPISCKPSEVIQEEKPSELKLDELHLTA